MEVINAKIYSQKCFREGSEFTGWGPFLGGPSFIFTYPQGATYFFDGLSGGPRIILTPSVGGSGFFSLLPSLISILT